MNKTEKYVETCKNALKKLARLNSQSFIVLLRSFATQIVLRFLKTFLNFIFCNCILYSFII